MPYILYLSCAERDLVVRCMTTTLLFCGLPLTPLPAAQRHLCNTLADVGPAPIPTRARPRWGCPCLGAFRVSHSYRIIMTLQDPTMTAIFHRRGTCLTCGCSVLHGTGATCYCISFGVCLLTVDDMFRKILVNAILRYFGTLFTTRHITACCSCNVLLRIDLVHPSFPNATHASSIAHTVVQPHCAGTRSDWAYLLASHRTDAACWTGRDRLDKTRNHTCAAVRQRRNALAS